MNPLLTRKIRWFWRQNWKAICVVVTFIMLGAASGFIIARQNQLILDLQEKIERNQNNTNCTHLLVQNANNHLNPNAKAVVNQIQPIAIPHATGIVATKVGFVELYLVSIKRHPSNIMIYEHAT